MQEIMVKRYEATDGKVFDDIEQCVEYEKDCEEKDKRAYLIQYAEHIKGYCKTNDTCKGCPFELDYDKCAFDCLPCNWNI